MDVRIIWLLDYLVEVWDMGNLIDATLSKSVQPNTSAKPADFPLCPSS